MQFLARSLSKSIRTSLNSTAQRCHSNFSSSSRTLGTCRNEKSESMTPEKKLSGWPRPMEIPYQTKIENSVDLIGYLNQPVKLDASNSWAGTVISPAPPHNFGVSIVFEGDLARDANCHLKKGDLVHINGKLFTNGQVLVRDFRYVLGSKAPSQVLPTSDHKEGLVKHSGKRPSASNRLSSASFLKRNQIGWTDCRQRKQNGALRPTHPDFKKKDKSIALWVHPNLSRACLKDLMFRTDHWSDLLDNPEEWFDYRESKRYRTVRLRHPDFRKKDGSVGLWLDRAPNEILSNLEGVKFDVPIIPISEQKMAKLANIKGRDHWSDLTDKPDEWCAIRKGKHNNGSLRPDFRKKDESVGLWLHNAPDEKLCKLKDIKFDVPVRRSKYAKQKKEILTELKDKFGTDHWFDLLEKPGDWIDYRKRKQNGSVHPNHPDFKNKETGVPLWLNNSPSWLSYRFVR